MRKTVSKEGGRISHSKFVAITTEMVIPRTLTDYQTFLKTSPAGKGTGGLIRRPFAKFSSQYAKSFATEARFVIGKLRESMMPVTSDGSKTQLEYIRWDFAPGLSGK